LRKQPWGTFEYPYDVAVQLLFADNNILMKKWLRYGEAMRKQQ
jgi:hypothetical protein